MTPAPTHRGGGDPRRRMLALALLLLLSLGLGAALAFQAIRTATRHRQTAERALQDYADFAAFILASRVYRQLGGAVLDAFAPPVARTAPRAGTRVPEGTACPAGDTRIEQASGSGAIQITGAPLPAGDEAFLRDTLRNAMPLLEEVNWRFRLVRLPASDAVDGFFITTHQVAPGSFALRGFSTCLGGVESPFRQVMLTERALPPAVTGGLPADSLFSLAVTTADDSTIYGSPLKYTSPYRGTATLGKEFGDLSVSVALRPDVAGRLVIGGLPSSPTPLAVGLLGLSTLLVVTALLQLRREYELVAIRSDFISNVSHELRTPLSQILIFTELLKLGRLRTDAERERSLDIIDQEARRLIRLVENVLQFSRSGGDRRRLDRESLPLAELVRETLEAFRPLANARGVTLRVAVPPQASVRGDRSALRQILLNLLDNAVKYGPRGQTVSVEAQVLNGRTTLAVEDQGPGVPLEERERVWEGFYRLERENRSAVAGSGIGLAVVRSLAGTMGGAAWVEDAATGGARFVVDLASGDGASA